MRDPPRGLLREEAEPPPFSLVRFLPSPELASVVDCYWITRWDLRSRGEHRQQILGHPAVQIVVERGMSGVFGIMTELSTKLLQGQGRALGIKLRPGAAHAVLGCPAIELADRSTPLDVVFGRAGSEYERAALAIDDDDELANCAERFITALAPELEDNAELVARITERIAVDRDAVRVDDIASEHGISTRTLQRLFERHVGVAPKWVIQRYRLHEALAELEAGRPVDFAALAARLNYSDQAHFIRDFTRFTGHSPARYARQVREPET